MNIIDAIKVTRKMGLQWTIFRINYDLKRKTGILKKRFPAIDFSDEEFIKKIRDDDLKTKENLANYLKKNRGRFLFDTKDLDSFGKYLETILDEKDKSKIIQIADNAINGEIFCFSHWPANYGNPINWHKNPITNYEWPTNKHWVDIEELSEVSGDVKYVWEASRFTQVFYFVRAYTITQDEKYAQAYWSQVEHWIKENPNQMGVNWKCGQEISFRTFAWIFGLYAFLDSEYTTNERVFMLLKNIYLNAIRIEKNIDFAIKAVQNNHAISEAAGLFTIGTLFPFFNNSERWLCKGKKFLEQEGLKQIYNDGSYIQNSTNYHRLMLQDYAWCYRLADLNGIKFNQELTNKLKLAIDFLYQMQDDSTGMVPNYGANDGALIFPLSACDYLNYKPQLNTINYIINDKKLYESGKHEEDLLWFCGLNAVKSNNISNVIRETKRFDTGGYYIIRGKTNSFGLVRCTKYKHRPGHADMLHFDLWYDGINVLSDIGSYSYNPEEKFRGYFNATKNHNTITVNDENQIKAGPRFLSLDWPEGVLNEFVIGKDRVFFSGSYSDIDNNIVHKRTIECTKNCYIINDQIENRTKKRINIKLNWNIGTEVEKLTNTKYKLILNDKESLLFEIASATTGNVSIYHGDDNKPAGWRSLYYGEKIPMTQLVYEIESGKENERIISKVLAGENVEKSSHPDFSYT